MLGRGGQFPDFAGVLGVALIPMEFLEVIMLGGNKW